MNNEFVSVYSLVYNILYEVVDIIDISINIYYLNFNQYLVKAIIF